MCTGKDCEVKPKILIVDDEPINLDFFDVMLSKLGFVVELAEDGEEALEKIQQDPPDLIILDNIMPKLTGWQVTRLLKTASEYALYKDIPIIMFSAMDDVADKVEGFELGIEDYIIKPFNFSEVLARIRAVLRNRELSREIVRQERQFALVESLNDSLLYFTEHLRMPVLELQKMAMDMDSASSDQVEKLRQMVKKETEETLAALDALGEEIEELKGKGLGEEAPSSYLDELEEKFRKHFKESSK
ncbi:MAG: response regulator transcription factor [Spirochaetales bacterium]|nr:response regulator transcription factor [Spirochaetales bacterium]